MFAGFVSGLGFFVANVLALAGFKEDSKLFCSLVAKNHIEFRNANATH